MCMCVCVYWRWEKLWYDITGLSCEHEEADDRIIAHISDRAKLHSKIAVASVDTGILISLLYHYEKTWKTTSDQLQLWWITKSGDVS